MGTRAAHQPPWIFRPGTGSLTSDRPEAPCKLSSDAPYRSIERVSRSQEGNRSSCDAVSRRLWRLTDAMVWTMKGPQVRAGVLLSCLLGLSITGCATGGPRCGQSTSECIGRCQAAAPDRKPALSANPSYISLRAPEWASRSIAGASTECDRERARRKTAGILFVFRGFFEDVSREHARPRARNRSSCPLGGPKRM